jgi:hypothetical protein
MKTVLNSFLAKLTGKPEEKLLVTDKDTISYVQTKMKEMENEALIQRMKFRELAIKHMTFEYKNEPEGDLTLWVQQFRQEFFLEKSRTYYCWMLHHFH